MNVLDELDQIDSLRTVFYDRLYTDPRYADFLRQVNEEMWNDEGYVGVAPYGSQFVGYAKDDSDFDVLLIAGTDTMVETWNKISDKIDSIAKKFGRDGSVTPCCCDKSFYESNLKSLSLGRIKHPNTCYSHASIYLAYPFVGKQDELEALRIMASKAHQTMQEFNPDRASINFRDGIYQLMYWELGVFVMDWGSETSQIKPGNNPNHKILVRGISESHLQEIARARSEVWSERIHKLVMPKTWEQ